MAADPRSRRQWQDAADAAQGALELDACRQYGLVTGGPRVNLARCENILTRAAARGIRPHKDAGVKLALAWNATRG